MRNVLCFHSVKSFKLVMALIGLADGVIAAPASALIRDWVGAVYNPLNGANCSWTYANNWQGMNVPGTGDAIDFDPVSAGGTVAYQGVLGMEADFSLQYILIEAAGINSIQSNIISSHSTAHTLTLSGVVSKPLIELVPKPTSGIISFGDALVPYGELKIMLTNSGLGGIAVDDSTATLRLAGPIAGSGGISKQGPGELDVINFTTDANSFTGGFQLSAGKVVVGKSGSGTSTNILGTGTFSVTSSGTTFTANSTAVTLTNPFSVSAGTFNIGAASSGALTFSGATAITATENWNVNTSVTLSGSLTVTPSTTLTVSGTGPLVITPVGTGIQKKTFAGLSISSGAVMKAADPTTHPNRSVIIDSSLTIAGTTGAWTGTFDLSGNDMIVHGGNLATLTNQIKSGQNGSISGWNGLGIQSSAAHLDTHHYTAIGVIKNINSAGTGVVYSTFDTVGSLVTSDVLLKYTYYGDVDLDGDITINDYSAIDNGNASHGTLTGWSNGDFNYDGVINSTDYTLIDTSYSYLHPMTGPGGPPLSIIASMPHWKMPGYAAEFLPIYEANFGKLSAADEQQYLNDGTPGDFARPAFAISVAAVPEPSGLAIFGLAGGSVIRRRKR